MNGTHDRVWTRNAAGIGCRRHRTGATACRFERARKLPFAHDVDEKTRRVLFDCVVDAAHQSNRKIRASVSDGKLVVSKGKLRKTMYTFVKFPSNDEVYGLSKDFSLRDFWGRKTDKTLDTDECDVTVFDQARSRRCHIAAN